MEFLPQHSALLTLAVCPSGYCPRYQPIPYRSRKPVIIVRLLAYIMTPTTMSITPLTVETPHKYTTRLFEIGEEPIHP